jgi:hypothetical protein
MRKKIKQILSIGSVVLGLFLATSPVLISQAQKKDETQKGENQVQDEQLAEARAAVAKSVVGSIFLDTISIKESSWNLNKAGYMERGEHNNFTNLSMLLKKDDNFVGIDITEYDSPQGANEQFDPLKRSYGISVPLSGFGDKADKLIGQNGDFMSIRFRQGNFLVDISTKGDVKIAERFAGYALEAIRSYAPSKQYEQVSEARAAVAKSVVGSLFLDTLLVKEPSWRLDKAGFFERGEQNPLTYLSMSLKKGDNFAAIGIVEYDSPQDANEQFDPLKRSYGASVPFNTYGDKGDKLIGQNGDLLAIRFRKGNFFVAIWNQDPKTAERFADMPWKR